MHEWTCKEIGVVRSEIYISFTVLHIYASSRWIQSASPHSLPAGKYMARSNIKMTRMDSQSTLLADLSSSENIVSGVWRAWIGWSEGGLND